MRMSFLSFAVYGDINNSEQVSNSEPLMQDSNTANKDCKHKEPENEQLL